MALLIRSFQPGDARTWLEVHRASVLGTASSVYPQSVIDAWSPADRLTDVERVAWDPDGVKILAVLDEEIVGIGEVVPAANELRACYVSPSHGRKGIGRAIVGELEQIARSRGTLSLNLDASLNAEAFYCSLGYAVLEHAEHTLGSGEKMACVKMSKQL